MARRDRVGARQPGVQRHQAGLGAEPDDRGDDDERLDAGALGGERRRVAHRSVVRQREHADPDAGAAEVGDRQVDEDGVADVGVAASHQDRGGRHQRHQLPAGEERGRVPRHHDADEGDQEQAARGRPGRGCGRHPRGSPARRSRAGTAITARVREEEAGEAVDPQRRVEAAAEGGAESRRPEQDEGAADAQQRDTRRLEGDARAREPGGASGASVPATSRAKPSERARTIAALAARRQPCDGSVVRVQLAKQRLGFLQVGADQLPSRLEQLKDARVSHPVDRRSSLRVATRAIPAGASHRGAGRRRWSRSPARPAARRRSARRPSATPGCEPAPGDPASGRSPP